MFQRESAEKRVTWAELFFDLVFVFAVTQVSGLLHHSHGWSGVLRALVVFVPIWWAWVGTSIHANTHDVDNPVDRIGIFAVGLCSLFMALAVRDAYGGRGLLYGTGYLAIRVVLAALVFRGGRITVNAFSVGVFLTGPLLVVGALVHGGWRLALWGTAALVDLAVPRLVRRRLALIRFNAEHLPERFGLFLIIALGESIVAVGVSAAPDPMSPARIGAVAAAFTLACALWWLYFAFAASAVRYSLSTVQVQTDIIRQVLAYGHLSLIGAIIAVAVGLSEVVAHPTAGLPASVAGLLVGGCALYLATFGYTRWRMFRRIGWGRLAGAGACLVALPVAPSVPALAVLGWLVLVTVVVNLVEAVAVRQARARYRGPELASEPAAAEPASDVANA
jgi:low temperature requirement protein LtrA